MTKPKRLTFDTEDLIALVRKHCRMLYDSEVDDLAVYGDVNITVILNVPDCTADVPRDLPGQQRIDFNPAN